MNKRRRGFGGRTLGGVSAPTTPVVPTDPVDVDDDAVVVDTDPVDLDEFAVESGAADAEDDGVATDQVVVDVGLADAAADADDGPDGDAVADPDLGDANDVELADAAADADDGPDDDAVAEPDLGDANDVVDDEALEAEPSLGDEDRHDHTAGTGDDEADPSPDGIDPPEAGVPGLALDTRPRITVDADGGLVLADDDGNVLQYAPADLAAGVRYLLARLRQEGDIDLPKSIGFTSTLSGEGVSVLARTFATVLAHDTGNNVCFVDLNWWTFDERSYRPDDSVYGLYEVLWMDKPLDSVLLDFPSDRFAYLPACSAPSAVRPTLAHHPQLAAVMTELADRFDHLVLDLPAVLTTSDAISLSQFADQVVLVVQQGVAARSQVQSALDDLGGTRPVAAVLNQTRSPVPPIVRRLIGS